MVKRNGSVADYVIVGGGTAGCAVARRLVERSNATVALLEASSRRRFRLPPLLEMARTDRFLHYHKSIPQNALHNRIIDWPAGDVAGGGSSVNAQLYVRGSSRIYDLWSEQAGCRSWSWPSVLPLFKRSESHEQGADPFHGDQGPVRVSDNRCRSSFGRAFITAFEELGVPENRDFNGENQLGAGFTQLTQENGLRLDAWRAYLAPVLDYENLRVHRGARATRLLIEKGRATGVAYATAGGREQVIHAREEVIVCLGTIATPKLLMLSGIGPADHLRKIGVRVKQDLAGVGRNIQDHIAYFVQFTPGNGSPLTPLNLAVGLLEFAATRTGILASNVVETTAFTSSSQAEPEIPDLQFFGSFAAKGAPTNVMFEVANVAPRSRGRIKLAAADPAKPLIIDPNYLDDPTDLRILIEGVKWIRDLVQTKTFTDRYPLIPTRETSLTDDPNELERQIRQVASTDFHPVGSCSIGEVVDSALRVEGIEGLRIADASIMPRIPNGNTQAAVYMIAERAADLVTGRASM